MADGRIKIAIEVDGKQVEITSKSLDDLQASGQNAGKGAKEAEEGLKGVSNESAKASGSVRKFATALGLVAIGAAAFKILRDSMDAAISRFDTLNTFPKVLQELGVSAEDSEKAMSDLSDGIDGLPTKLDEIASTAQRMYTSFDDMDVATDSAIALNNALLGSGSSADQARRGTEQYLKALQTGKMEMDTWNTLSETMDVALVKLADEFGYAGRSAKSDLYDALKEGHITMDQFNAKLIEIGTGTGDMARLAKENSLGLATSMTNLRTAVSRGVANVITSFDNLSQKVTGNTIAQNIDNMKDVVSASFAVVTSAIDKSTPVVIFFADTVKAAISVVQTLTPAIIGLMTAYGAYVVITKASAAISASNKVLETAIASQKTLTLVKNIDTAATAKNTGALTLNNVIIGVLTGRMKLSTAAMIAKAAAAKILGGALRFLSGPVGWVVTGIGALVTATVAVVKWFKRSTAEAKRLNGETENLGNATEQLNDDLEQSAKGYKDQQREMKATADANEYLAKRVEDLASKENKSAAEKQMLNDYINQLNESVTDLGLAYDEEANALSMSSEELATRVGLMDQQTSYNAALERQVEIMKEQSEVEQQLEGINALRADWNEKLEEGSVKSREHKDAIAELDEQETLLKETNAELAVQFSETEEQLTTSMQAITEATESGIAAQKLAYEDLSEAQQKTVDDMKATWQDYKDAATDMFDTLSDEATVTVEEMASNLEENQRIIGEWAEGIASLTERGVDEGLLDTLREAGPESAGHVNALVNASDTELEKLSGVFAEGGETATNALSKSLGISETGVMNAIGDLVVDTEKSLREQINTADFSGIGGDLTDGLAGGITDGTSDVEAASRKMAEDTTAATRKAFQTHSPSKVYDEIGGDLTDGLALGITSGTIEVLQAVQDMFNHVIKGSSNLFNVTNRSYKRHTEVIKAMMVSQFGSIGTNSMAGLNAGLNAGSRRVMATARAIANNVNATMKRALDIRSPSRKARDEVGKEYVAGIGLGIIDNAKVAYDAIGKLSTGMLRVSTPEMALGTSSMAYSGGGASTVSNRSFTENKYNTANMQGMFEGANFHVRSDNDIPRLAKELNDYIKTGARSRGVIMP